MKISFDLDDTLIPANVEAFPVMKRNIFQKVLGVEPLRVGIKAIIDVLRSQGHEVGIYTTSYRPTVKIRYQLLTYGIKVDFIINEQRNRKELKKRNIVASKYPPAFGICLHIDDSKGVALEGERLGFNTAIIENHADWQTKIMNAL